MTSRKTYLTYKSDTSRLLYWVINTYNSIVKSGPSTGDEAATINSTGQSTVAEIISMTRLIAKHIQPVPDAIIKLLQSIVDTRTTMLASFQEMVKHESDAENKVADALGEAVEILRGNTKCPSRASSATKETKHESTTNNSVSKVAEETDEQDDESSGQEIESAPVRQQKKARKGKKKVKRNKKSKQNAAPKSTPKPASKSSLQALLAEVPIESYRIIDDEDSLELEYRFAAFVIVSEWRQIRSVTQGLWREVAYDDLNGAVAAALTNIAAAMVKETCFDMLADFPDRESYEIIIQAMARDLSKDSQANLCLSSLSVPDNDHEAYHVKELTVDAYEHFWVYAYKDLMTFITDFQKNRNGKPTKALQKQLNRWSPSFDLRHATDDERITWRRLYTISWLYDLVNLYSSVIIERNGTSEHNRVLEEVDWSAMGPGHQYAKLFGLNGFAADITTLAMQKHSSKVQKEVFPHHVFQLQCIVDSFTASQGWTLSPQGGHVLVAPPQNFRARRDIDIFLDREDRSHGSGLLPSIVVLIRFLHTDAELQNDPNRHKVYRDFLEKLKSDLDNWLGESRSGHISIPESQFSKHNSNGLWEYSPLLCAAGLVEGLVLIQRVAMHLWDQNPEPDLALHLHNMLFRKGYLKREVRLYTLMGKYMIESFFPNGFPTGEFASALKARIALRNQSRSSSKQLQAVSRDVPGDFHDILDANPNILFTAKSFITTLYEADWRPELIPDSDVVLNSSLLLFRLGLTERVYDYRTRQTRLKPTDIVNRTKAQDHTEVVMLATASHIKSWVDRNEGDESQHILDDLPRTKGVTAVPGCNSDKTLEEKVYERLPRQELLAMFRSDTYADVCGTSPISSFNYIWITCHIMVLFLKIRERLRSMRHPLWVKIYEHPQLRNMREKTTALIQTVFAEEDEQTLQLFADVFESSRTNAMDCVFWGKHEGSVMLAEVSGPASGDSVVGGDDEGGDDEGAEDSVIGAEDDELEGDLGAEKMDEFNLDMDSCLVA